MAYSWKISHKDNPMRILEEYIVLLLSLLIFFLMLLYFQREVFPALLVVLSFLALYLIVRAFVEKIFIFEEAYHIKGSHLHIHKNLNGKVKKEKVYLKDVKKSSFDHHLLGAYIVSENQKHVLHFNSKKEIKMFKKNLGS